MRLINKMLNTMRIKSRFIFFLSLIACIHPNLSISNSSEVDPYPTIEIPVYHKGYNVEKFFDHSKETKSVIYRVQTDYAAAEVIEFYDAFFNGKGWRPSFEICQRNWGGPSDKTPTGAPAVRQLFASWEHLDFNLKVVLWIRHEMVDKKRQGGIVVKCQLQPR
jgi:hypothetical protein